MKEGSSLIENDKKAPTFAELWENRTSEELFKILADVGRSSIREWEGSKLGFHQRRAAARILARRKFYPTSFILLRWLNEPQEGVGDYVYGYEDRPHELLIRNDSEPSQILNLAIESLGLMRYEPSRIHLRDMLEQRIPEKFSSTAITRETREYFGWPMNAEGLAEEVAKTKKRIQLALERLDDPDIPETDIEDDLLLYIAASTPIDYFRKNSFKELATKVVRSQGSKVAQRYIEALRKLPDMDISFDPNSEYRDESRLVGKMALTGTKMDGKIEKFEKMCDDIFQIVKTAKGLSSGGRTMWNQYLFDGSVVVDHSAECLNHFFRSGMLESVSSNRNSCSASLHGTIDYFEDVLVTAHFFTACNNDRHGPALDDLGEAVGTAGIDDLDDIGTKFGAYAGSVLDVCKEKFVFDFRAASVHHRNERHLPLETLAANIA